MLRQHHIFYRKSNKCTTFAPVVFGEVVTADRRGMRRWAAKGMMGDGQADRSIGVDGQVGGVEVGGASAPSTKEVDARETLCHGQRP